MQNVLNLLKQLKYSFPEAEKVFTNGSCFRLCLILQAVYGDVDFYYSHLDGHWITSVDGKFYDINGEILPSYIQSKEYALITVSETLASAYVPTYGGQSSSYKKYKETI